MGDGDNDDAAPRRGARVRLERPRGDASDEEVVARYRGTIETPAYRLALEVTVRAVADAEGRDVAVRAEGEPTGDDHALHFEAWAPVVATMARRAVRNANKAGLPPPRRIQRWRDPVRS
ncbi:MAG: hypothetical protein AAF928_01890 [Myxococcota bacterium]